MGSLINQLNAAFSNQQALADSHIRLDEQFAVLARLVIQKTNEMADHVNMLMLHANKDGPPLAESSLMKPVTYEDVNQMFADFIKLRERPDFREHMQRWYMGGDLNNLPPVPSVEVPSVTAAMEEFVPDGAQTFGGDYGQSEVRDEGETSSSQRSEG